MGRVKACPECKSRKWDAEKGAVEDGQSLEAAEEAEPVYVAAPRPVLSDSFMVTVGKQGESSSQGYPVDGTVKGIPTGGKGYGGRDLVKKRQLNVPITAPKKWE